MDLVLPSRVETDVSGRSARDNVAHSMTRSSASVLVPVSIESVEINALIINVDASVVLFATAVPTVDLVEVELECD